MFGEHDGPCNVPARGSRCHGIVDLEQTHERKALIRGGLARRAWRGHVLFAYPCIMTRCGKPDCQAIVLEQDHRWRLLAGCLPKAQTQAVCRICKHQMMSISALELGEWVIALWEHRRGAVGRASDLQNRRMAGRPPQRRFCSGRCVRIEDTAKPPGIG